MVDTREVGKQAGVAILVFATVGVGLGLSGYLSVGAAQQQFIGSGDGSGFGQVFVGIIMLQSGFTMFLLGPVVASSAGLLNGIVGQDQISSTIGTSAGTLLGFYVMVVLGVYIMVMAADFGSGGGGGSSTGSASNILQPVLAAGVPTTIVGAVSSFVGSQLA
ncbi:MULTISPECIES: hypothetical protein [unclassified Haloarcula]|uniref:hypothetical protein n=1 Tax=unclassified Haloarcula TaxID=2624677 RepID=UPI000EF1E5AE|nr:MULTISPECIES: hypothetical protein [unclassified Haloarcula]RLM34092.1 hypothetical protein DVK01_16615 [Haloarcula sp. Atlit-120R]RLM42333.1 hypothetical protein DVK00_14750 [Haloarcula sp. Atlit-47R]